MNQWGNACHFENQPSFGLRGLPVFTRSIIPWIRRFLHTRHLEPAASDASSHNIINVGKLTSWLVVEVDPPLWKRLEFVNWDDYSIPNSNGKITTCSSHQPDGDPLAMTNSDCYWTWPFIVDFPITKYITKYGDSKMMLVPWLSSFCWNTSKKMMLCLPDESCSQIMIVLQLLTISIWFNMYSFWNR